MKILRADRPLIAWTLYLCVLVNLLACGVAHGQAMGLQMSGIAGMDCTFGQNAAPATGDADGKGKGLLAQYQCPVCAGASFGAVPALAIGSLLRPAIQVALPDTAQLRAAPRHLWPSANPRASPQV